MSFRSIERWEWSCFFCLRMKSLICWFRHKKLWLIPLLFCLESVWSIFCLHREKKWEYIRWFVLCLLLFMFFNKKKRKKKPFCLFLLDQFYVLTCHLSNSNLLKAFENFRFVRSSNSKFVFGFLLVLREIHLKNSLLMKRNNDERVSSIPNIDEDFHNLKIGDLK